MAEKIKRSWMERALAALCRLVQPVALAMLALMPFATAAQSWGNEAAVSGQLTAPGQQDIYSFSGVQGQVIVLSLVNTSGSGASLLPRVKLYSAAYSAIQPAFIDKAGNSLLLAYRLPYTYADLRIAVGDQVGEGLGTYNLRFLRLPGANSGGALPSGGGNVTGDIQEAGDLKVYTVEGQAGRGMNLRLAGAVSGALRPQLIVFGPNAERIVSAAPAPGADLVDIDVPTLSAGNYTVVVSAASAGGVTGGYALSHAPLDTPFPSRGVIPNGGHVSGNLDAGGIHVYQLTVQAVSQQIWLRAADNGNNGFVPRVTVYGPDGTVVGSKNNTKEVGDVYRGPALWAVGVHTVTVTDPRELPGESGSYSLYFAAAGAVGVEVPAVEGESNGVVVRGGLSTHTFNMSAGDQLIWSLVKTGGDEGFLPRTKLFGSDGQYSEWEEYSAGALFRWGSITAEATGSMAVVVGDLTADFYGGTPPSVESYAGSYRLLFTRLPGANGGGAIPNGGQVSGSLPRAQRRAYTFTAQQGDWVRVSIWPPNVGSVVGPDNRGVDSASYSSTPGFRCTQTGTYTVLVSNHDYNAPESLSYDIHLARLPGANEGGALVPGVTRSARMDRGDLDSYTFHAAADDVFQIRATATSVGSFNPQVQVIGPDAQMLVTRAASQREVVVDYTARLAGVYSVVISNSSNYPSGSGDYTVLLNRSPGANDGGALTNGSASPGSITEGDSDTFTFTAAAGQWFYLSLVPREPVVTNFYPRLTLVDAQGAAGGTHEHTHGAFLSAMAVTSGEYRVVVDNFYSSARHPAAAYDLHFIAVPGANGGGRLRNGVPSVGAASRGDLKTYTFEAQTGDPIELLMTVASMSYNHLRLHGPDGALLRIASPTEYGSSTTLSHVAPASGVYTVVATVSSSFSSASQHYSIVLRGSGGAPPPLEGDVPLPLWALAGLAGLLGVGASRRRVQTAGR